jgi:hypothetical protein
MGQYLREEFLYFGGHWLFRDVILMVFIVYAFTLDIYLAGSGVSLPLNQASTVRIRPYNALGKIFEYRKIAKSLFAKLRNKRPGTAEIKMKNILSTHTVQRRTGYGSTDCIELFSSIPR